MRVITGTARGTKLKTPEGMLTRPTTDRVKEALFNIIQFDIEGRQVLDLTRRFCRPPAGCRGPCARESAPHAF